VVEAGENAILSDRGGVRLEDGTSIGIRWELGSSVARSFSFDVAFEGEGVLTYTLAGGEPVEVVPSSGPKTIVVGDIAGALELTISFAGEGAADVSGFKRADNGVMLFLR
jgi:hypothetical protein